MIHMRFFSLSPENRMNLVRKKVTVTCDFRRVGGALLAAGLFCCLFATAASANNITMANSALHEKDAVGNTIKIQFDISWENSWRDFSNYDAAWVFVKYCLSACSDGDTGTWHHATLKTSGTNPTNFSIGSGTVIDIVVPSDKKGAFIQRHAAGSGTLSTTAVKFVWDYGADGVTDSAVTGSTMKFRLFAIEMTYIPQGAFSLGDTAGASWSVSSFEAGNTNLAFQLTSENALTLGGASASNLGNNNNASSYEDFNDSTTQSLSAAFPKGYAPFYLMKYEVSQGQYVRFLNTLTRAQQQTRVASDISGDAVANNFVMANSPAFEYRNTIQCNTSGNGVSPNRVIFNTGSRNARAASYISWMDLMAYADWAGLRPMTELEFEKAARGPAAAVAGEYAWGTTNITQCGSISGGEDGTESCNDPAGANCNYTSVTFPGGPYELYGSYDNGIYEWPGGSMSGNYVAKIRQFVTASDSTKVYDDTHYATIVRNDPLWVGAINATPSNGGGGYLQYDVVTIDGGSSPVQVQVDSVDGMGVVLSVSKYQIGFGYPLGPNQTTTGGTGSGLTVEILSYDTYQIAWEWGDMGGSRGVDGVNIDIYNDSAGDYNVDFYGTNATTSDFGAWNSGALSIGQAAPYTPPTDPDGGQGPLRVGIFAAGSGSREQSGAGYYGNLDLSGNLFERAVTIGNATGRAFTGTHGNGALSTNGNADVSDWPGYSSGEVTGALGAGFRGGYWGSNGEGARTSNRVDAAYEDPYRYHDYGGRVGRTAP